VDQREIMIGILGALDEEIALLKTSMDPISTHEYLGRQFFRGRWHGQEILVVKSGIGKIRAAITATALVSQFGIRGMMFTGVGAALQDHLQVGDVVLLHEGIEHDFGMVDERGFRLGLDFLPGEEAQRIQADPTFLELAWQKRGQIPLQAVQSGIPPQLHRGQVATGDLFVAEARKRQEIRTLTQADVVEMEGVAVLRVAVAAEIPCLLVRSISDSGDSTADFLTFFVKAAQNSVAVVEQVLQSLP